VFAKNLGLLTEVVPQLARVGILRQADREAGGFAELQATARRLNVELDVVNVRDVDELASAFATMKGKRVGAVIIFGPLFYLRRQQIADLALEQGNKPADAGLQPI
jgi:ABC-type uncharacterized transport system substrate-binding protein